MFIALLLTLTFFGSVISIVSATTIDPSYECTFSCPTYVKTGVPFGVTGTLTQNGNPVASETLDIAEWGTTSETSLKMVTTDENGNFGATITTPLAQGDHVLHAVDDTTQYPRYRSDDVTVHVDTYSLSLAASPNPATSEQSIVVSGRLTMDSTDAGVAAQTLDIKEFITVGGQTSTESHGNPVTDADGYYSATIGPLSVGEHKIRAKMGVTGEGQTQDWALSDEVTLVVTAPTVTTSIIPVVTPKDYTVGATYGIYAAVTDASGTAVTEGTVEFWRQLPSESAAALLTSSVSVNDEKLFEAPLTGDNNVFTEAGTYTFYAIYKPPADSALKESQSDNVHVVIAPTVKSVKEEVTDLQGTAIAFSNTNNHKAFDSKLSAVYKLIDAGDYATARDKIKTDLMPKTDGVAPEWVTTDQATVYAQLQILYEHLGQL